MPKSDLMLSKSRFRASGGGGDLGAGTDLLHLTEEGVGALDLPLTQLSQGHLLEVNLHTGQGHK